MKTEDILIAVKGAKNNAELEAACMLIEDVFIRKQALNSVWYCQTLKEDKAFVKKLLLNL